MGASLGGSATLIDKKVINDTVTNVTQSNENITEAKCIAVASNSINVGGDFNMSGDCEINMDASASCFASVQAQNSATMSAAIQNQLTSNITDEITTEKEMTNDGFTLPSFSASYDHTDIKETVMNTIENNVTMKTMNKAVADAYGGSTNEVNVLDGDFNCSGGTLNMNAEAVAEAQTTAISDTVMNYMGDNAVVNDLMLDYENKVKMTNTGLFNSAMIMYIVIAVIAVGFLSLLGTMAGGKKPEDIAEAAGGGANVDLLGLLAGAGAAKR